MNIQEFIKNFDLIQDKLQEFLNNADNIEENFSSLISLIDEFKIRGNYHNLKLLLRLLISISNDYHREGYFFDKIAKVLTNFKHEIQKYYSNSEKFNIFKRNKRILLFFVEDKMIQFDKYIIQRITKGKYIEANYHLYFAPEIKPFINEKWFPSNIKTKILQIGQQLPENFYEDRRIGENSNFICILIQKDLIKEFIAYVNKTNFSLKNSINDSIYETNRFLIRKPPKTKQIRFSGVSELSFGRSFPKKRHNQITLIEYATFYGSIQIFKYLMTNKICLTPSLWIYAMHGQNSEIIHILEENHINPEDKTYKQCIIESIKCHHNDIVDYLYNNHIDYIDQFEKNYTCEIVRKSLKYYNFSFIQEKNVNSEFFYSFCKYDYFHFVDSILKSCDFKCIELSSNYSPLYLVVKKEYLDLVELLLSKDDIFDVNSSCLQIDDKEEKEKTALYTAVEKGNDAIVKLLLGKDQINVNAGYSYKKRTTPFGRHAIEMKDIEISTPLFVAVENENIEIIKMLLSNNNIDVNAVNKIKGNNKYKTYSITALYAAVEQENVEIVKLLLSKDKIDVNFIRKNLSFSDKEVTTSLFIAMIKKNFEIVKLLLEKDDIDVNIINCQIEETKEIKKEINKTVLYIAAENENYEIVDLLLKNEKIDVNIINKVEMSYIGLNHYPKASEEKTVFYLAIERDNYELINRLLKIETLDVNIKYKYNFAKSFTFNGLNGIESKISPMEII